MLYIKLILLVVCCFAGIYASDDNDYEKPVERYSPLVNYVMNRLSLSGSLQKYAHTRRSYCKPEVDNSIYANFFRKAQEEIGIPKDDILPVIDISREEKGARNVVARVYGDRKIEVIRENFDFLPYGAQNITALHEAYHNKYHDTVFMNWFGLHVVAASGVTSGVTTWGLMKLSLGSRRMIPIVSGLANVAVANTLLAKFSKCHNEFLEYRADRDAVISADCHYCVREYSYAMSGRSNKYLQSCEITAYAQQFKRENKVCQVHALDSTD